MDNKLQRKIMRRVYYSFAISIAEHPMFWHGMVLSITAVLLARWLHVASIVENLLATPMGQAPAYVANSFANAAAGGELLTVAVLMIAGLAATSFAWQMFATAMQQRVRATVS